MVTEHGLNSDNDAWRADLITAALAELKRRIDAGTPMLGYCHWSLVDNFEWTFGYKPHYGLASIDAPPSARPNPAQPCWAPCPPQRPLTPSIERLPP
jgi:beta-glucosidase